MRDRRYQCLIQYFINVATWLSLGINAILGGSPYQTFSARNFDWYIRGKPNLMELIDLVLGKDHCFQCWKSWRFHKRCEAGAPKHRGSNEKTQSE